MTLKEYEWKIRYRSDEDNLLNDFYIPALERSVLYQRAAGFFSTGSLVAAAKGIVRLIHNGGKMQLVVSPNFSEEDLKIIQEGYIKREEIVSQALEREFLFSEESLTKRRIESISWMIAKEDLDLKIAIPVRDGKVTRGIYHEKMGIFRDEEDNMIVFSGSINESQSAYMNNFESFDVQLSWESGRSEKLVRMKCIEFENLWRSNTNRLEVIPMPEAIKEKLLKLIPEIIPKIDPEEEPKLPETHIQPRGRIDINTPVDVELRQHQEKALNQWVENKGRGVLQHATGSGKTITALNIAASLFNKSKRLSVIILAPQKHIVDQWYKEARKFGFNPILGYEKTSSWYNQLNRDILSFNMEALRNLVFITTNASFSSPRTQNLLKKIKGPLLIIGDEVHNLGAGKLRKCFLDNAQFRLGLTATPDRWYDEQGTSAVYEYFGSLLKPPYGIKEAIDDGYLCRYMYYPHLVELTEIEAEEYIEITEKISNCAKGGEIDDESESSQILQILLMKRARMLGKASNKINMLREIVMPYRDSFFNLFYAGDGIVEGERQIEKACQLLGLDSEIKMRVEKFTAEESIKERNIILERFTKKDLQGIVAIRCLDEGVDIPGTQRAFILASSTNPRQFIQRRGRILRNPNRDDQKIAEIHDFIVIPPSIKNADNLLPKVFNIERNLVKKEMTRFAEFAETAENGPQARKVILELRASYNLLDFQV
jgi:DNA phosphorothioation system restriction enzyme